MPAKTARWRGSAESVRSRTLLNHLREACEGFKKSVESLTCTEFGLHQRQALLRRIEDHLDNALRVGWVLVWSGDSNGAQRVLDELASEADISAWLPDGAEELHVLEERLVSFRRCLQVGASTLRKFQSEVDLVAHPLAANEALVLEVLGSARRRFLRRGEIQAKLPAGARISPVRVGQILASLGERGLLLRLHQCARGNAETSFFQLSGAGRQAVKAQRQTVALERKKKALDASKRLTLIERLVTAATSANEAEGTRRVAVGWLSRECSSGDVGSVFHAIWQGLAHCIGTRDEPLARDLCRRALRARVLSAPFSPKAIPGYVKFPARVEYSPKANKSSKSARRPATIVALPSNDELSRVTDALIPAFSAPETGVQLM